MPAPHIVEVVGTANGESNDGGYILYSNGAVTTVAGAPFYGDAHTKGLTNFVSLAQTDFQGGYWLVTATGQDFPFGSVGCDSGEVWTGPSFKTTGVIVGTVNAPEDDQGYDAVNTAGKTFEYSCQYSF